MEKVVKEPQNPTPSINLARGLSPFIHNAEPGDGGDDDDDEALTSGAPVVIENCSRHFVKKTQEGTIQYSVFWRCSIKIALTRTRDASQKKGTGNVDPRRVPTTGTQCARKTSESITANILDSTNDNAVPRVYTVEVNLPL